MTTRKPRGWVPDPVRFKGGGLHGQVAPGTLVDTKLAYHAYRTHVSAELAAGAARCDIYEWEAGSGWMSYVGTAFGYDGTAQAVKDKTLPKIKPPPQWAREFEKQGKK